MESFDDIESLIRNGLHPLAVDRLKQMRPSTLAPKAFVRFCSLARRAGVPLLAVRVLNHRIHPNQKQVGGTAEERAEYAAALIAIGAVSEALTLLQSIDGSHTPSAFLFRSFAHMNRWEYAKALPHLESYVAHPSLTPYEQLVGNINLAGTEAFLRRDGGAEEKLIALIQTTEEQKLPLLYGNALGYLASLYILQHRWDLAEERLKAAEMAFKDTNYIDSLFIQKWKAVLQLLKTKGAPAAIQQLEDIKNVARKLQNWETVRDCDRHLALATRNEYILMHLYFGTPFKDFKMQLLRDYPSTMAIPDSYAWHLGGSIPNPPVAFDLNEMRYSQSLKGMKNGQLMHRMFSAVSADFYRPIRVATLFNELFPGEFFNPESSPGRIYQAARLLQTWLRKNKLPLKLTADDSGYQLEASEPCALILPNLEIELDAKSPKLAVLKKQLSDRYFTIHDATKTLGLSPTFVGKILQDAVAANQLIREGKGKRTRYRFPSHLPEQKAA